MPNKYGAIKQTYNGYTYHSKKEAQYAFELDCRIKVGEIISWKRQVKIELRAYDKHICNYYIDFVAELPDGNKEYIEVKGFSTNVFLIKWKMFKAKMAQEQPRDLVTIIR